MSTYNIFSIAISLFLNTEGDYLMLTTKALLYFKIPLALHLYRTPSWNARFFLLKWRFYHSHLAAGAPGLTPPASPMDAAQSRRKAAPSQQHGPLPPARNTGHVLQFRVALTQASPHCWPTHPPLGEGLTILYSAELYWFLYLFSHGVFFYGVIKRSSKIPFSCESEGKVWDT